MSSYKHLSGSEKRKRKADRDKVAKQMKRSLDKFLTVDGEQLQQSSSFSQISPAQTPETSFVSETILQKDQQEKPSNSVCEDETKGENINLKSSQSNDETKSFVNDIALWPEYLTDAMREYYIKNPPKSINGSSESSSIRCNEGSKQITRKLTIASFFRTINSGKKVKKDWLAFTETNNLLYCYVCKLFSKQTTLMTKGTNDWKNVHKKLSEHENSSDHINSILIFITRSKITGRIDTELEKQIINEKKYWREVLKRVVATIKFISSYSLAFRGKNEVFFSENNGNYIGALEYLSEFDPFLREHMKKYANCGTGTINYLSSTICDEFISIISKDLQLTIVNEIKEAKFYSLIIDSTPDISHVDQLTVIICYVLPSGIKERFLGFLPIFSHTGEKLEKVILEFLNNIDLDITNCRGQSYDNAFNMSGIVRIFFSSSTHRWNALQKFCKSKHLSIKPICDTRWSARSDAVKSLKENYEEIKHCLRHFSSNIDEKPLTRSEAADLHKKLDTFEYVLLLTIWEKILERIDASNKTLQQKDESLNTAVLIYDSLIDFIQTVRDDFDNLEKEAEKVKDIAYTNDNKRQKIRKLFHDEIPEHEIRFSGKEHFKVNIFFVVCDSLISNIKKRSEGYKTINNKFKTIFHDSDVSDFNRGIKML
ncbi:zinc finger MYM-type protein 1-like [Centruroides vittatus]|uniref:zinc finger MYM-type protein 1-like n=1 Tax=Centruroides vittatus TaxID=120091 RepID=UPI00350F0A68